MNDKEILRDVKPTPHYKRHPRSRITIRTIYVILAAVLIWAIWRNWDFWTALFK